MYLTKKFSKELKIIRKEPILLVTLPIALFFLIILYPFKKIILIRFGFLHSDRIGHFAMNTELSILEDIKNKNNSFLDLYYFGGKTCNTFLAKKWAEKFYVLPSIFIRPFSLISRKLSFFKHNVAGSTLSSDNDVLNLIDKYSQQLSLSEEENQKGYDILKKVGVPKSAKIICLIVRDEGYLNKIYGLKQKYHDFRNMNINDFELGIKELIKSGFYVFRMGNYTYSKLNIKHKRYLDYSKSKIRSDFMDIFLGSKCFFCVSTNTGFDAIPWIFRRPILYIGSLPIGIFSTNTKKIMVTSKIHYSLPKKRNYKLKEIFSNNIAYSLEGEEFKYNKVKLKKPTKIEIKNTMIDMMDYVKNNFTLKKKYKKKNKLFWQKYLNFYKQYPPKKPIHGKIRCVISPSFLKKHQEWLLND